MFAKIKDGFVNEYPIYNIRDVFPNTSFPAVILQSHLPTDYVIVEEGPLPIYDYATQRIDKDPHPSLVDGKWITTYTVSADIKPIEDVSPRQLRQALNALGLRTLIEDTIVASGDQNLKDWWEFSTSFERNHPLVISMGESLGIIPVQIDALWQTAATL